MLSIDHLTKSYAKNSFAVQDFSLTLNTGDFCMILGANGSGKSTLFKLISGKEEADSGIITLGNDLGSVSIVSQDVNHSSVKEMTLLENLTLSYLLKSKLSLQLYQTVEHKIKACLKQSSFPLMPYLSTPLFQLSGGQRQQAAMVMALMHNPEVLLLDEHTSALDPRMQKLLMKNTTMEVKKRNITTMMITHQLSDALLYGNRLVVLHEGRKVIDLSAQEKSVLCMSSLLDLLQSFQLVT
jgi:putative ABC transport system ATP-binding protein